MTKSGKNQISELKQNTPYFSIYHAFTTQEIDTMLFIIWNRDFPNRNQVTCAYISSPRLSVNKTHSLLELATVNLKIKTNGLP